MALVAVELNGVEIEGETRETLIINKLDKSKAEEYRMLDTLSSDTVFHSPLPPCQQRRP